MCCLIHPALRTHTHTHTLHMTNYVTQELVLNNSGILCFFGFVFIGMWWSLISSLMYGAQPCSPVSLYASTVCSASLVLWVTFYSNFTRGQGDV